MELRRRRLAARGWPKAGDFVRRRKWCVGERGGSATNLCLFQSLFPFPAGCTGGTLTCSRPATVAV